jgi:hypothetical protein
MSSSSYYYSKRSASELVETLVEGLAAEVEQGVPRDPPSLDVDVVSAMVLPGPSTTAAASAEQEFNKLVHASYKE